MQGTAAVGLLVLLTILHVEAQVGPAPAASVSYAPALAPGDISYNIVWTLTADNATITDTKLVLGMVSPATTYFATVPEVHIGNLETDYFVSNKVDQKGRWLGAPEIAVVGEDAAGNKKVALLAVDNPVLSGDTVTFEAIPLYAGDKATFKGGPVAAFMLELEQTKGRAAAFATVNQTALVLQNVTMIVDGAMERNPQPQAAVQAPKRRLLQMGGSLGSPSNDGFTFDCSANTPWRPVGCGQMMAPISNPMWNRRG